MKFYESLGKVDRQVFEDCLDTATSNGLVDWGGMDDECTGLTVANPEDFDDPDSACSKLSKSGQEFLSHSPVKCRSVSKDKEDLAAEASTSSRDSPHDGRERGCAGRGRTQPAWITPQHQVGNSHGLNSSVVECSRKRHLREGYEEKPTGPADSRYYYGPRARFSPRGLPRNLFLPQNLRNHPTPFCRHFHSATYVSCKLHENCKFAHVQPPLSMDALQSYKGPIEKLFPAGISLERDGQGGESELITAVYQDPHTKIYYMAQNKLGNILF